MTKKAIIFHGTAGKPTDFWYPWLSEQLKHRGFSVEIPDYPDINREPIKTFLPKVLKNHSFNEHTTLIGHSAGASLILSILENIEAVLSQAVLVAGFSYTLPGDDVNPILQDEYNWVKIRPHAKEFVFINSDNDPWGCNDEQGRLMFDKLGGTQIIRHDGHFGSGTLHQRYDTFELLDRLIV